MWTTWLCLWVMLVFVCGDETKHQNGEDKKTDLTGQNFSLILVYTF